MRDYDSITDLAASFKDGLDNGSGIQEIAYFIPRSWLTTIAAPDPAGTTAASLVEISGNHVLAAGKSPIRMEPLFDKSGLTGESVGEVLSSVFQTGAEFFFPQLSATVLGTAGAIKNYRGLILLKRMAGGDWIQIGSEEILAKPIAGGAFGTGQGPTGEPGIRVNFQAHGNMPYYIYKGELPAPAGP
ncbi:hypothetical protein [Parapedobacter lycopersici]|uniref:hypothetical protein n=1 Tax=Parapedobacter lycopersici TaxID=1864939 RepID=UPI00333EFFE4